jgi:hypothetical protein
MVEKKVRWENRVARMVGTRKAYVVLVAKLEEHKMCGTDRRKREGVIDKNLK